MAKKKNVESVDPETKLIRALPYILIVTGIVGLISSFVLTYDKMQLLKNPSFTPNCNLDPVLSCGNVMHTAQSSAFGFPNPWIGLAAFAVLVTVGVGVLAGAKFARWFWLALEAGIILGLAFAYWLLFESVYRIQALCPYCLAVDVVLISAFWYLSLYLVRVGHLPVPARLIGIADFARRHHAEILVVWLLILVALILQHFWYYYGQFV